MPAKAWTRKSLFQEHRASIDLVVLDLKMPGTPGDEALRAIKSICPAVEVLIARGLALHCVHSE